MDQFVIDGTAAFCVHDEFEVYVFLPANGALYCSNATYDLLFEPPFNIDVPYPPGCHSLSVFSNHVQGCIEGIFVNPDEEFNIFKFFPNELRTELRTGVSHEMDRPVRTRAVQVPAYVPTEWLYVVTVDDIQTPGKFELRVDKRAAETPEHDIYASRMFDTAPTKDKLSVSWQNDHLYIAHISGDGALVVDILDLSSDKDAPALPQAAHERVQIPAMSGSPQDISNIAIAWTKKTSSSYLLSVLSKKGISTFNGFVDEKGVERVSQNPGPPINTVYRGPFLCTFGDALLCTWQPAAGYPLTMAVSEDQGSSWTVRPMASVWDHFHV